VITLDIIEGPEYKHDADGWEHQAYTVQLKRGTRRLTTPWRQGMALTGRPDPADVLSSLMLDASGYENAETFEEWAADYGFDADSRKAEALYKQVGTLTRKLKRFLGDDFDATATEDAEDAAKRLVAA
jgi:hypothetical protein